ncbi:hypothetical protein ACLOJK_001713 [Asimina triloba]
MTKISKTKHNIHVICASVSSDSITTREVEETQPYINRSETKDRRVKNEKTKQKILRLQQSIRNSSKSQGFEGNRSTSAERSVSRLDQVQ